MGRTWLIVAAAAVLLTAFAPAPLPRRQTPQLDSVSLKALMGDWKATSLKQTGNGPQPARGGIDQVTITQTQWIFNRRSGATPYDLRIDHTRRPAEIDLMHAGQSEPYGRGIVKREGNVLRVVYHWGAQRPTGFENQPPGYWELTLVRE